MVKMVYFIAAKNASLQGYRPFTVQCLIQAAGFVIYEKGSNLVRRCHLVSCHVS